MDMNQYLEIFIDESKEHLQEMNQILLELENKPDNLKLLDAIFRIAHTIKGMAGTMGYSKITNLTHKMESLMHEVRTGKVKVSEKIVDILFECFDALEEYVENLIANGEEGALDTEDLVNKLAFMISNGGDVETEKTISNSTAETEEETNGEHRFSIEFDDITKNVINKAIESDVSIFKIDVILDENCMLKAARSFIVFNKLESFGEVILSKPDVELIEDEKFDSNFEILYFTKLDQLTLYNELMNISEIHKIVIEEIDEKIEVAKEDKIINVVETNDKEIDKISNKLEKKDNKKQAKKASKTVRVDIERLDNLMNLVSELIIIKTRLEDDGNKQSERRTSEMHETIEYLERITTSLHDAVMKVRMVPVERTFNRFPRMVRDLSKELGKGINLVMSGEDTEVDRTVIDEIGDPLIHLIRNSIDHGIEDKATRIAKGKDENGTVALRAYPDGNTVVIEVEDDGNGIDSEKIKQIAINREILTESDANQLSEKELINLLFNAGFSTAKKVTDLSGRGVGLDVVKSKIESLNGTVEVDTVVGKGSKFIIRLPLTLAIIQALMITLKEEIYAIPLNNIKEISTINSEGISMIQDQEVVLYRGKTLPLIRLGSILDTKDYEKNVGDMLVVVIKKGDQEAGIIVDELIGQQEIVIKSLGRYLKGINIIAGATILGNGGVALIVDSNQLF
ncbi:chemotaxis protein CheA [Clostridiaceae bacterium HSG29]|nr:chemotaxis protein CheA [Clostridiaceae bacterium HSG29]